MSVYKLGLLTVLLGLYNSHAAPKIRGEELHRHFSIKELQEYFGVSTHSEVPQYDLASPFKSNQHGHFVSYNLDTSRRKRNVDDDESSYYKVNAFGRNIHMKMVPNQNLMRDISVETHHNDGRVSSELLPRTASHYIGNINDDHNSVVAVTKDDRGLTGIVHSREHGTLFIQPLSSNLTKHFVEKKGEIPHLLSKSSLQKGGKFEESTVENGERVNKDTSNRHKRSVVERRQLSNQKYIEAAVMVDDVVQANYGNKTEMFVLMVANIVAGMFLHNSIGEMKVNYVVTRIIRITNTQLGTSSEATNGEKLTAVSTWAGANNPVNESDPGHFDVVSLIHRGGGGGLALSHTMCAHDALHASCNVAKDQGLQTAFILAHEVAHNMGVEHDGVSDACPSGVNIMSASIPQGPGAMQWSSCSSIVLQQFLRDNSHCLDDVPSSNRPYPDVDYRENLPGRIWNADKQCIEQMGTNYFQCPHKVSDCGSLFCTMDGWNCVSHFAPSADGTRCGDREWCIQGDCVDDGSTYIDGGWSAWSGFTVCSRTCGGGVRYKSRTCTNPPPQNGGDECEGTEKGHFEICNYTPCPYSPITFRDKQCMEKDPNYRAYYYTDEHQLVCLKGNIGHFFGNVTAGTPCYKDPLKTDVSIAGVCEMVGCDGVLNSGAVKDRCNVCNGDGSTCKRITGTYTKDWREWGLQKGDVIVRLPVGTTSAAFKKLGVTWNLLGIAATADPSTYFITLPSWSVSTYAAGSIISYSHEENQYKDELSLPGPTSEELNIYFIWLYEQNQGVSYQYYVPLKSGESAAITSFLWTISDWTPCSVMCAGGVQKCKVTCYRDDDRSSVGYQHCDPATKPASSQTCNTQPCEPEWDFTRWTECSKTCGKGSQTRSLQCRQQMNATYFAVLQDSSCLLADKLNESTYEVCNQNICPAKWKATAWSACSVTCGSGVSTREYLCKADNEEGVEMEMTPDNCLYESKPPTETKVCNTSIVCPGPGIWKEKGSWLPCSTTCGPGNITKVLLCVVVDGEGNETEVSPDRCEDSPKPPGQVLPCNQDNPCPRPPEEVKIACFRDTSIPSGFPEMLADYTASIDFDNTNSTVLDCGREAFSRGYNYFALGQGGKCYSGPNMGHTYFENGAALVPNGCKNGVGLQGHQYVYTFIPKPSIELLGCYDDNMSPWRAMPNLIASFRNQFLNTSQSMNETVYRCSYVAQAKKYDYFGVQWYGECWAGSTKYDKWGPTTRCYNIDGSLHVGGDWGNFVYRLI